MSLLLAKSAGEDLVLGHGLLSVHISEPQACWGCLLALLRVGPNPHQETKKSKLEETL